MLKGLGDSSGVRLIDFAEGDVKMDEGVVGLED